MWESRFIKRNIFVKRNSLVSGFKIELTAKVIVTPNYSIILVKNIFMME